jgi:mono/diheme cytochrome c family protein
MKKLAMIFGVVVFGWMLQSNVARGDDDDAVENFGKHCATCHGKNGKGKTDTGAKLQIKDLTDPKIQASFTDADAQKQILNGSKDKAGNERMPSFKDKLQGDEVQGLIKYVRTFKGK